MLLAALEILFSIIIILFLLTQVIYPFFRGTQLFPILLKEAKIEKEIVRVNQETLERDLTNVLRKKLEEDLPEKPKKKKRK
jgi:hypothetical protein